MRKTGEKNFKFVYKKKGNVILKVVKAKTNKRKFHIITVATLITTTK